jgi:hypothetical protein
MPAGYPIVKTQLVSPFVGGAADGSINREIRSEWSRRNSEGWDITEYAKFEGTTNLIDTLSIPQRVEQFQQLSFNGKKTVETPGMQSFTISQKRFALTVGLNRILSDVAGLSDLAAGVQDDLAAKVTQHIRNEAVKALVANPTRTNIDGLTHFHATHPINPSKPGLTNPQGTATQPNLFTTSPLSHVNVMKRIQDMLAWVDSSGQPMKLRHFTIFVTPSNLFGAAHWLTSLITGTNFTNAYGGAGNDVGASSNPILAAQADAVRTFARKRGITIDIEVLEEYSGALLTDWFIVPHVGPVWGVKMKTPHYFFNSTDPASPNALSSNMDLYMGEAVFGVSMADIWSIAKCTA